jgi:hypothetical protein
MKARGLGTTAIAEVLGIGRASVRRVSEAARHTAKPELCRDETAEMKLGIEPQR